MVYKQNILYYRCAATNFEELHSVTIPATAMPADVASAYAGKENIRLVKITTLDRQTIHKFDRPAKKHNRSR